MKTQHECKETWSVEDLFAMLHANTTQPKSHYSLPLSFNPPASVYPTLCRSPPRKLFQIFDSSNTQYKPPTGIRNNSKILRTDSIYPAHEEFLQLLQRGIHRDDLVDSALPSELRHGLRHFI